MKCEFETEETEYLGLIIGHGTVKMDPVKVKAITEWPVLTNKKELQSFLGFLNFYHRFIEGFSTKAKALTKLTGNIDWQWTEEQEMPFQSLKATLISALVLALVTDEGEFKVEADVLGTGIGGILSQKQNNLWHLITFFSCTCNAMERNYEIYDLELLTIIECPTRMESLPHGCSQGVSH